MGGNYYQKNLVSMHIYTIIFKLSQFQVYVDIKSKFGQTIRLVRDATYTIYKQTIFQNIYRPIGDLFKEVLQFLIDCILEYNLSMFHLQIVIILAFFTALRSVLAFMFVIKQIPFSLTLLI
eukprot:TRINITY_DN596_c0_g1_i3.p5 TRINITY_DN596_c0_g1~~TRINITY_DN596_c0_g1_i3.p5  ORF type:complete len:121 (+),score=3.36 TRINITY_DN596_c0_g1_i3:634-996(+)